MSSGLHYENANATSLGLVRAAVFSLWLGLFLSDWPVVAVPPPELFVLRGVWLLVPQTALAWMLSPAGVMVLPWVFIPVVLAAILGLRPYRLWGPLAAVCILVYDGWYMGLSGFIYHAHSLALVVVAVLTFAPAGDGFTLGSRKAVSRATAAYRFPLLLMVVAGLLCYTMIGVHRLSRGDYGVFNGDALRSWLLMRSHEPASTSFTFGITVANTPWLFNLYRVGFLVSTLMEVASLLCLRSRLFARVWLVFFTVFHCLSLVTLNIFFWENTLLLWLLFLPLGVWLRSENPGPHLSVSNNR